MAPTSTRKRRCGTKRLPSHGPAGYWGSRPYPPRESPYTGRHMVVGGTPTSQVAMYGPYSATPTCANIRATFRRRVRGRSTPAPRQSIDRPFGKLHPPLQRLSVRSARRGTSGGERYWTSRSARRRPWSEWWRRRWTELMRVIDTNGFAAEIPGAPRSRSRAAWSDSGRALPRIRMCLWRPTRHQLAAPAPPRPRRVPTR